jgi:hypothetical protein
MLLRGKATGSRRWRAERARSPMACDPCGTGWGGRSDSSPPDPLPARRGGGGPSRWRHREREFNELRGEFQVRAHNASLRGPPLRTAPPGLRMARWALTSSPPMGAEVARGAGAVLWERACVRAAFGRGRVAGAAAGDGGEAAGRACVSAGADGAGVRGPGEGCGVGTATFVVGELSGSNPNVFLEIGYAWGKERPTVLIAREGEKLQFDRGTAVCCIRTSLDSRRCWSRRSRVPSRRGRCPAGQRNVACPRHTVECQAPEDLRCVGPRFGRQGRCRPTAFQRCLGGCR